MDYGHRDYFLVCYDFREYNYIRSMLKVAAPTLKTHAPYNHLRDHEGWDGQYSKELGIHHPFEMISCRKEDSECVEYELRKATRSSSSNHFVKLSKNLLGQ